MIPKVIVWMALPLLVQAQDWPQFRGPTGQGHSAERGLPLEWSESRNIVWKTAVPGNGWSSPVIAGGRVWLTSAIGDRTSIQTSQPRKRSGGNTANDGAC